MEEKLRMRPQTARPPEDPFSDLSSSPTSQLSTLSNLPSLHFPHLQKLELKVDIEEVPFHKFGVLCPNLRELKLSNSNLESIRSLGTEWKNLEILWLVQTGLQNIDGISVFPKLKELYCAFNSISSLSPLFFNETVQILDFEGNQIEEFSEIESLQYCSSLFSLNLEGNPVCKVQEYRGMVFRTIQSLTMLDDMEKESESRVENSEELEIVMNSVRETSRMIKKSFAERSRTEKNIFCEGSRLTEEVFSGNPIKAMRFRRKKLFEGNNFLELVKEFKVSQEGVEGLETAKNFRIRGKKEEMYDTR